MKYLVLILIAFPAFAIEASRGKQEYCHNRKDPTYVKELAYDVRNLMSFKNHGGIGNGGVCWWHSRFQRNALYLTYYTPNARKPTPQEARQIINDIRNYRGVIEINGFENFYDFSKEYKNEIQSELEAWQIYEGVRLTFIRGLRGSSKVSADLLKELMENFVYLKKQLTQ